MKKFLIATSLFIYAVSSFCQFSVGPRLGMNISTCSGKYSEWDESKSKWIPGLVVGAVGDYAFTKMISLNSEIYFITSGSKCVDEYVDGRSENDHSEETIERYGSIEIPVLAKFTFGNNIQYYANLGPYFKFVLCGKLIMKDFDHKDKIDPEHYKTFDMGMYVGGGIQKQFGPGQLVFDARFGMGFFDTYQFSDGETEPNGYKPFKNRNISLTFAYMIPLGAN